MNEPIKIECGMSVDERGKIVFLNDPFKDFVPKRMYIVENHFPRFVRAWHGHAIESKLIKVVSGAALIGTVPLDYLKLLNEEATYTDRAKFKMPDKYRGTSPRMITLNEGGRALLVPPGHANGAMTLLPGTKILYFSDKTLEESNSDDQRFDWDIIPGVWKVEQR